MQYSNALRKLNSLSNYEIHEPRKGMGAYDLTRFRALLDKLGHPQRFFPVIHVAGTKGKGSVSAMTAQILKEAGLSVGLYTSPHLWDPRERIRLLGERALRSKSLAFADCMSSADFAKVFEKVDSENVKLSRRRRGSLCTYFEVLTAMAFVYFKEKEVDVVVLETGLGGRLDATNVVAAAFCGITSISCDHGKVLGKSLLKIIREKMGIIHDSAKVVIAARQPCAVSNEIETYCRKQGVKVLEVGREIKVKCGALSKRGQNVIIKAAGKSYSVRLNLLGRHQAENAALAVGLAESFLDSKKMKSRKSIEKGLTNVQWPGRFEIVRQKPFVVCDVAHNPASFLAVKETLRKVVGRKKIILVLGLSKDKDAKGILKVISPIVKQLVITRAQHPRAMDLTKANVLRHFNKAKVKHLPSVCDAVEFSLRQASCADCIVIAGSVFVVAEAKKKF